MDTVMEEFIQQLTVSQRQFRLIREEGLRSMVENRSVKKEPFAVPIAVAPSPRNYVFNTFDFRTNFFRNVLTELHTYVMASVSAHE